MQDFFSRFLRNESGATAIEYALIAAFIALALITTATLIGTELRSTFTDIDGGLKSRPK